MLAAIKPRGLVCLGATAAQALLGRDFRVTRLRRTRIETNLAGCAVATVHPSSVLRQRTDADRDREMARFVSDLQVAASLLNARGLV